MNPRVLPVALIGSLFPLNSLAQDPVLETDNATVRGSIHVDAPAEHVRAFVGEPIQIARLDGRGATVDVLTRASCSDILTRSPTIIGQISYRSRVCPTGNGWSNTLLSSEDLDQFHAVWSVEPEGSGSKLSYELTVVPKGPVPLMLVVQGSKSAVKGLLSSIRDVLERR